MKKALKFAKYSPFLIYVPSFGKVNNMERLYLAMTLSIAKVYARKLSKKEALMLINNTLDKKNKIENLKNTKFDSFDWIITSICGIISFTITIIFTLIGGSILGTKVYKNGKIINEKFSKELEQTIPLYLFF